MASLRDAQQLVKYVEGALSDLKNELRDGSGDFEKLTRLADEIGERADALAETFSSMDEVLVERIGEISDSDNGSSSSSGSERGPTRTSSRGQSSRGQSSRGQSSSSGSRRRRAGTKS